VLSFFTQVNVTETKVFDFAVVGGGLVGLATAYALLQKYPDSSLVLIEKEEQVAAHQSGRNSGVLHSGVYYKPGSLKAQLTAEGRKAMLDFCNAHGVAYEICGKVIVATSEEEIPRLDPLYQRGRENKLDVRMIDAKELAEIEPQAKALKAIWIPQAGIVDYKRVAEKLADELRRLGAELRLGTRLLSSSRQDDEVRLATSKGEVRARIAVNCGGLFSDRLARQTGVDPGLRIVPFRGEYFALTPEARGFVRGLIYPLADPRFPFLGVHLTKMTDGNVLAGPNAVFSTRREGYHAGDFDLGDTLESLSYSGFWRLVLPNLGTGLGEMMRAWNVRSFATALQKLVPAIEARHLVPTRAGVRAQAVDKDGKLVEDFRFARSDRWLHVLNAPSPAATASLAIGRHVAAQAAELIE
jgi:L-2-hydroxyglutarate oxidase